MKHSWIRCAVLAGLSTLSVGAAAQPVSKTGAARPGIDVLHYTFEVSFPARAGDTLDFVSRIRAARSGVADVQLDLVATMRVNAVAVNGTAVTAVREGDRLRVPLGAAVRDTVQIDVRYRGIPTDGLILGRDSASGQWTAFGDNFPDRARQWLALVDHPSDKATVEWVVRTPASHRVIANGDLLEETPIQGGATLTRYRTRRPLYPSVMVIGVAPFAVYELGAHACPLSELPGCVRQSVWVTPDVRDYLPGPFAAAGPIVEFFSERFGPFPYEKLAHVQSTTRYGGMENASAIFYADGLFRRRQMSEGLIAHEMAHQWFGDAVTEREWPHVWLSEGFATYAAALWTEHAHGDSAFRAELRDMRTEVIAARITDEKPIVDESLDDLRRVLSSNVYPRAGFVLHMLRREVGDSAFFRGIKAYYLAHRHGNALTSDFRAAMEASSGQDLGWFFDQWLSRRGLPRVELSWLWDSRQRSVIVTASQLGSGAPYRLSLAVQVVDPSGNRQATRLTIPAGRVSTLHIPLRLSGPPGEVVFDPDVSILGTLIVK